MTMLKTLYKYAILMLTGGLIYGIIECIARGYSHWTMIILGGICFVAVGALNEQFLWETPFILQMLCGGGIITLLEFATGYIVNIALGWNVWDYSTEWCNVLGQICPKYTLFWMLLSAVAIVLDDWLRYKLFSEEKPKYKLF